MRRAAAVAAAAALACAGREDGVTGPAGVGERYRIEPVHDRVLVGALGDAALREAAVRVAPLDPGAPPPADVEVRFERRGGAARLLAARARTGRDGVASVALAPAEGPDSTTVRAWVADDPGAAVELALLNRPLVAVASMPGAVVGVPDASAGVLLQVPPGAEIDLLAFSTAASRGGEYELRRGLGVTAGESAARRSAPPVRPATPALAQATEARPGGPGGGDLAGAGVPAAVDAYNCAMPEHRRAPLVWLSSQLALYLDEAAAPDSARLREIARAFEEEVAPRVIGLFGPPVDLDRNGRVLVVMSPAMPDGGAVYCTSVHRLSREVVYLPWNPALATEVHVGLLAHELQHLINASQHFRHGRTPAISDVIWLDEGFSLVAEWASGYPAGPLRRTFGFLPRVNGALSLLSRRYELRNLGGWFLFALYLGDRFGEGVYLRLGESGLLGRENVERVTGVPFRDVLRDWFLTLALVDDPRAEPAWRYRSIDLAEGETARIAACRCVPGHRLPVVGREELPGVGPLRLLRTLDGQDADFLRLPPRGRPATLYFQAGGNPDVELVVVHRRAG